jgi:F420-non-reducing hydrogenase iron-sulfur subunit
VSTQPGIESAFAPRLVCFTCKFGWGYLNGSKAMEGLHNVVPVTCSGKVDAVHIVEAFRRGADGVLILGCPEGECHFQNGNHQARKRVLLMRKALGAFGIEKERIDIELDMDPEGSKIEGIIERMLERLSRLGPASPGA